MSVNNLEFRVLEAVLHNLCLTQAEIENTIRSRVSRHSLRTLRDRGYLKTSNAGWQITLAGVGCILCNHWNSTLEQMHPRAVDLLPILSKNQDAVLMAMVQEFNWYSTSSLARLANLPRSLTWSAVQVLVEKDLAIQYYDEHNNRTMVRATLAGLGYRKVKDILVLQKYNTV